MTSGSYQLYARPNAGSLAPQMLLEEIGAPYELLWVGKSPADIEAFRRVSTAAKIPVLVLPDGTAVSESAAILIHLVNAHPAAALAPPGPGSAAYARFLQWMVFLSANMYEALLRYFYAERYSAHGEPAAAQIRQQALADWGRHLETVSAVLSPYVLGAQLSAADHYLYMLAGWYPSDESPLISRLTKLREHMDLMQRRPAIVKAQKDHSDG